jgi:hypothetical protein
MRQLFANYKLNHFLPMQLGDANAEVSPEMLK